jgi:flagellar basal-body rod protein FlgB
MSEPTLGMLEKLVGYTSLKQKVINKNIANLSTESYVREEVSFQDFLSGSANNNLNITSQKHITPQKPSGLENNLNVVKNSAGDMYSGVNNVDIEKEMADLAENTIVFKFAVRKLSGYFKNVQSVIKGGRA